VVKALLDTNILVDYLKGIPQAKDELAHFEDSAVSMVTWMEVMVGATPENEAATRQFLRSFSLLPVDDAVAEQAVLVRRKFRMRLPDAIILASAQVHDRLLVTRNSKDFPEDLPGVRIPYRL
jgi:predicted nucleic acid-binding protein